MAGIGPAPKPASKRRRYNKPASSSCTGFTGFKVLFRLPAGRRASDACASTTARQDQKSLCPNRIGVCSYEPAGKGLS